ncbi:MAG: hypothetical protein M1836_004413 [Candelina mexicana]|nr:MAG: hypothetical protein M1836_004413 [Candelina mexicana]
MLASGFVDARVSKYLLFSIVTSSIIASITNSKYLFHIQVAPHLWRYKQIWRLLIWQGCYTNSTEVLFAAMTAYHLRIIERLWGTHKFTSFIISTLPYTALLPPLVLALILRPLSLNTLNYLPAGPTPVLFALLAQYHAVIPHVYKYRLATSSSSTASPPSGPIFSDKSISYLLAAQLALSQVPGSLISAVVGWCIGYAWRNEILPGAAQWRVPSWVLQEKSRGEDYEGLRRRLEDESLVVVDAASGVVEGRDDERGRQRRTLGPQILDQFRGAF